MSDRKLPNKLNAAAIIQIVSGVTNIFFMAGVSTFIMAMGGGFISAICTFGFCPAGVLCGFAGFPLVLVGIVEILSGVLIMTSNPNALTIQRYVSIGQKVAILFGGLGSFIASFVVDGMVNAPDSLAFLEE